ncbi:MAG: hypothetical protein KIT46_00570 [Anaerolineales bacterium]|nr:hypothetical protein [Anaerolineales bacterium]MCW5854515.1 hypothetical protein [Anaerolineales bacterium]
MAEVLRFFVQYEAVLYFVLGLGGIVYIYRFWLAWQEISAAIFDLEREASRGRLNQAALSLFVLLVLAVVVFIMTTFVATTLPAQQLLATPTLDFEQMAAQVNTPLATSDQIVLTTPTPLPTVSIDPEGCVPEQIFISEPEAGDSLSGAVQVSGTVDVPNFGFYKFEVARAEEELWLTIQAGRGVVREGVLVESWDTSRLPAGDYVLQLVVTDSSGADLPPCRIPVQIQVGP